MRNFSVLILTLIITLFISCSKESNGILSSNDKVVTALNSSPKVIHEKKGGKNQCAEYQYSYQCTGAVFFGSGTTTTCINIFRGNDRIVGIELGTSIDCLTSTPNGTNTAGNVNCGDFVELYYKNGRLKYRVVLSGGVWDDECAPSPDVQTCLDFHLVEIGHDGKHDQDCLTSGPIDIGPHTICITNLGQVPN